MFVIANLLFALSKIVELVLTVLYWIILIRALISWVSPDPMNPIVQMLNKISEPILEPIRRILPSSLRFGPVDISPIIAFLIIFFLKIFLVRTLVDIAIRLA